jgi:phosphoribosylformylglycinamidine cyclo-ligase
VLVASCDGVGTKLLVARQARRYDTVGIDIVNHSVNDILTLGARPLFFLDYIAHAGLTSAALLAVVRGLARACRLNGCALVGGETAMMPDVYRHQDFDLAGFIVGVVEQDRILDPNRVAPGDVAIGLPASGLHTNGYSLARRVLFDRAGLRASSRVRGLRRTLGAELLTPHRSYLQALLPLLSRVKALAHITGGGFRGNISRLLPPETSCIVRRCAWQPLPIFRLIQRLGHVPEDEMYRTFNMGIGMVVFAGPGQQNRLLAALPGSCVIGRVVRGNFGVELV